VVLFRRVGSHFFNLAFEGFARPLLKNRSDDNVIPFIKADRYASSCMLPDSAISTDEFWLMLKFEDFALFSEILDPEKAALGDISRLSA